MRNKRLATTFLFAAFASLAPASFAAPSATAVTVTPAVPESGDSAAIAWEKAKAGRDASKAAAEAAEEPVYIVKVYVKLPPAGAEGYRLWIGDEEVREYGSFRHGLFFKAYGEDQLSKWAGKPLRMGIRGKAAEELGREFPGAVALREIRSEDSGAGNSRKKVKDVLSE